MGTRYTVGVVNHAVVAAGALLVATAACAGSVRGPSEAPLSVKEIVDRSKPAIVRVESTFANKSKGYGTGFIVGRDGRIITNLHVILDIEGETGLAERIDIVLLDGTRLPVRRVVDLDPGRDLAMLGVDAGHDLPVLRLADSDRVSTGERVVAIGNPLGVLDYTVSDGIISSIRQFTPDTKLIQFSAPISKGSSGGPLFNNHGEVIAVTNAFITTPGEPREAQNLNFSIPANYIKPLLLRRGGKSLAELRVELAAHLPKGADGPRKEIERQVPEHPLSILDGCSAEDAARVFHRINDAIKVGAPLYNLKSAEGHEACYKIYEGTALVIKNESPCRSLADAVVAGIRRAEGLGTFTEKAWAMRDAFDGAIIVITRRIETGTYPIELFRR